MSSTLPMSGKFKNGNPITMGKVRPNTNNYYSSVINNNANIVSGLPTVNTESYRLMTPNLTMTSSSKSNISTINLGDENLNLTNSRVGSASASARPQSMQSMRSASNSYTTPGTSGGLFPSASPAYSNGNNDNPNSGFSSVQGRSATPFRTTRQQQQTSNNSNGPSLPAMNGPSTSSLNNNNNGVGLLFSSSLPNSSSNNINNNINNNNTANNRNYSSGNTSAPPYNYNYSSSSSNNNTSNHAMQNPKNSFVRSNTAPASVHNNGLSAQLASDSLDPASAANALLLSVDGKREWNIRDSITMPPIKHVSSSEFTPSFNALFREEGSSKDDFDDALASSRGGGHSTKGALIKSMKKVRFAEPIAHYEPMTNTLRNRIINEVKAAQSTSQLEVKSVLKVGGSNNNASSSSHGALNSTIVNINTMNNTLTNKSIAANTVSKAMNQNVLGGRPISAPLGIKASTTAPATNPILTTRDQVVKKSLLEIQNRIVNNLNSLSTESEQLIKEEKERRGLKSEKQLDDMLIDNLEEGGSSKRGENGVLEEKSNTTDFLLSSSSSSNNSPLKQLEDVKRPKSASMTETLLSPMKGGANAVIASLKSLVPLGTSSPRDASKLGNNIPPSSPSTASSSSNSANPAVGGTSLFNLMAKSILIGNYSCRVVNHIQFYADHFEFLFPQIDFASQSLFSSTNNTSTASSSSISHFSASNGNYSSLRSLMIYYKDVSNITLLSNKMRCRLAPNWHQSAVNSLEGTDNSEESKSSNATSLSSSSSSITSNIHGYLCIEFSSLSYMIIMKEKIIPIISTFSSSNKQL